MADAPAASIARVLWHGSACDVAVLRWPTQEAQRQRLDWLGIPRLLLVEAGSVPPGCVSCLEDWTRLPAPDADLFTRISTLRARANRHPPIPMLDELGRLSFREHSAYLPPGEHALAQPLVEAFREPVPETLLLDKVFPDSTGTPAKLRLHAHRLRKRIEQMGLQVTPIRSYGYMMANDDSPATPDQPNARDDHDAS